VILVDSSAWIDCFRGTATPPADRLDGLLASEPVAIGDLMLTEVLRWFVTEREFNDARKPLLGLDLVVLGGGDVAVEAAKNYRKLGSVGVTMGRSIDTVMATGRIVSGHLLQHSNSDFEAFEQHLGLCCVALGA
jgi:predicted nucleic acid-binding protein